MKKLIENIPSAKGVYVLFLRCEKTVDIRVGSFGRLVTKPGIYAYVGSAYGGGGLKSRLARHLKTAKKCRWHVDYIRRYMKAETIWYTMAGASAEHEIASALSEYAETPLKGFGSSDCNCYSHLFYMNEIDQAMFGRVSECVSIFRV